MEAAVCLIAIFKNSADQNGFSIGAEAEAHIQRLIHPALVLGGDLPGPLPQAVFVQRADLLKQDDAVLGKARVGGPDVDVGGKPGFVQPGCNGGCDDCVLQRYHALPD